MPTSAGLDPIPADGRLALAANRTASACGRSVRCLCLAWQGRGRRVGPAPRWKVVPSSHLAPMLWLQRRLERRCITSHWSCLDAAAALDVRVAGRSPQATGRPPAATVFGGSRVVRDYGRRVSQRAGGHASGLSGLRSRNASAVRRIARSSRERLDFLVIRAEPDQSHLHIDRRIILLVGASDVPPDLMIRGVPMPHRLRDAAQGRGGVVRVEQLTRRIGLRVGLFPAAFGCRFGRGIGRVAVAGRKRDGACATGRCALGAATVPGRYRGGGVARLVPGHRGLWRSSG